MALTKIKVIDLVLRYFELQKELKEFKDKNFIWIPDEWVFRTEDDEKTYKEMEEKFKKFSEGYIVVDMDGDVYRTLS